jgi:hypothetical protein
VIYFYLAPDPSEAGIKAALALSLCPFDAIVQADPATGLVRIETPGVWRADKNGHEEGLGVPGWSLVASEVPGAPRDPVEIAKVTVTGKPPIDIKPVVVKAKAK